MNIEGGFLILLTRLLDLSCIIIPVSISVDIETIDKANEEIDYLYEHCTNDERFIFDTRDIKNILGQISLNDICVIDWIKSYIIGGLMNLNKKNK